jgi:hypothetical protein
MKEGNPGSYDGFQMEKPNRFFERRKEEVLKNETQAVWKRLDLEDQPFIAI